MAEGFCLDLDQKRLHGKKKQKNTFLIHVIFIWPISTSIAKGLIGNTPKRIEIIDNIEMIPYLQKLTV